MTHHYLANVNLVPSKLKLFLSSVLIESFDQKRSFFYLFVYFRVIIGKFGQLIGQMI